MVRKSITNSVIIINHIFQVSIMLGLGYLQSLTETRALVMRHLYQRNLDFKAHFLSDLGLMIQSMIIMVKKIFYFILMIITLFPLLFLMVIAIVVMVLEHTIL